jgi:hypothetical protein
MQMATLREQLRARRREFERLTALLEDSQRRFLRSQAFALARQLADTHRQAEALEREQLRLGLELLRRAR